MNDVATVEKIMACKPKPAAVVKFNEFTDELVDRLEWFMKKLPQCEEILTHRFTPGLYSRQLTMPTGAICVSLTHLTEHQFTVSRGSATIWSKEGGVQLVNAPFHGITKPGTRRVFFVHSELVITNFHATNETDPDKFIAQATSERDLSHITDVEPEIKTMFNLPKELS